MVNQGGLKIRRRNRIPRLASSPYLQCDYMQEAGPLQRTQVMN